MNTAFSDLRPAGLSTPLTRLIEVISAGIGKVSAPFLLTRTPKAKAKELKHIAEAIKSVTNDADLSISYDEGKSLSKRSNLRNSSPRRQR